MTPTHQAVPTLDLEDLERKARAASPVSCWVVPEGDLLTDALSKAGLGHYENYRNDAEFIAAANPETVLQLLALARSASEAKAEPAKSYALVRELTEAQSDSENYWHIRCQGAEHRERELGELYREANAKLARLESQLMFLYDQGCCVKLKDGRVATLRGPMGIDQTALALGWNAGE